MPKLTQLTKSVTPIGSSGHRQFRQYQWSIALLAFLCVALSPRSQATCEMGCNTGSNTVLGDDALLNNTGFYNTGIGFQALYTNSIGSSNTATGQSALFRNTTGGNNTATGENALYN